eukprot:5174471-Pleurochrysis_carterae.AAC.1
METAPECQTSQPKLKIECLNVLLPPERAESSGLPRGARPLPVVLRERRDGARESGDAQGLECPQKVLKF